MRDHAIYLEEDDNLMIEIQAEDDVMYPAVMNQTISGNSVDTNPSQMDLKVAMCNSTQSKPRSCVKTSHIEQMILMCESLQQLQIPSYSAYNSVLLSKGDRHTGIANILMFPLIPGPADDYNAIYTGFKLAQNVTTYVCDQKTIITLELDLYKRALKLRNSSPELMGNFILRLGELVIVFAQCRAIGRYPENTGIDDAWLKSELNGPCTIRQVIPCSHMKRALIIHEATLLAFYERYIRYLLKEYPNVLLDGGNSLLQSVVSLNSSFAVGELEDINSIHSDFRNILLRMEEILKEFDDERQGNLQYKMIST